MLSRLVPPEDQLHELTVLIEAHHPLLLIESVEEDRARSLLAHAADRLRMPLLMWTPTSGLVRQDTDASGPAPDTETPAKVLSFIESADREALYLLRDFPNDLNDPGLISRMKDIYRRYFRHRGALILTGPPRELPPELEPLFTPVRMAAPTPREYHHFISSVLRDIGERRPVRIELDGEGVTRLLEALGGLTFFEVRKIITQAVVEDGCLDEDDLSRVFEAKRRIVERSGVLEYFPHDRNLGDIAGLVQLKAWLKKRRLAFTQPEQARSFGLEPPRGLLLIGVQGCGKSLCAKAVAAEWSLPLLRLDPSNLYQKFFGESERNLKRAIRTAEDMAPVVLWIDEIEKALGQDSNDGGTSQRVFGTFLSWLQEKKEEVFVIATANDIARLPPELLRKGRFDEIFFVDLPIAEVRERIFEVHLKKRHRAPEDFDLSALAAASEGFSGAEIEQAVVGGLYTAFSNAETLETHHVLGELGATKPLSVTMREKIDALRAWAKDRAVPAG